LTTWRARTGWQRRAALVAVLAAHAALFTLLGHSWMLRPPPNAARVAVRLIPTPTPVRPRPPAVPAPRTTSPLPSIHPGRAPPVAPAPALVEPPVSVDGPGMASGGITVTPEAPASQPRPLDLSVRRGSPVSPEARNPALQDPRSNTARTTPEQRMSAAFDTHVIEESLGDGRKRIRQGSSCVIVTPSRAAQINPLDEQSARTPSLVSACP
jgi:hypothetical protein